MTHGQVFKWQYPSKISTPINDTHRPARKNLAILSNHVSYGFLSFSAFFQCPQRTAE
jgi:hypothetical protein